MKDSDKSWQKAEEKAKEAESYKQKVAMLENYVQKKQAEINVWQNELAKASDNDHTNEYEQKISILDKEIQEKQAEINVWQREVQKAISEMQQLRGQASQEYRAEEHKKHERQKKAAEEGISSILDSY